MINYSWPYAVGYSVPVYCMVYWRNTFRLIERDERPAVDKVLLIPERPCQFMYMSNKSITSSLKLHGFVWEWVSFIFKYPNNNANDKKLPAVQ